MKTLYEILEVSESASDEVIEKAYKVLAKKYHPDLQSPENKKTAESKMKEINEAYEILGNSEKRKTYDAEIRRKREEERIQQEHSKQTTSYQNKETHNTNPQPQANMQNQYNNQINEMQRKVYEENLRKEEEIMRRQMQANLEQEYQNAYYDYLRSLGFRIKEKWTWKKTKELFIIILIFFLILAVLWILPPTREMMVDFYESNSIFRVIVDIIRGIIVGIFNGIKSIFSGE